MLPLVKGESDGGCPKEKVMSKKCKGENQKDKPIKNKKDKKKKPKKEKHNDNKKGSCVFSAWAEWSPCSQNNQQRVRKVRLVTDYIFLSQLLCFRC